MDAVSSGEQPQGVDEDAATPVPDQAVVGVEKLKRDLKRHQC
jgi:hypothetical protein